MSTAPRHLPEHPTNTPKPVLISSFGHPRVEPSQTRIHVPLAIRFGARLRSLRHAKGMTQLEIAVAFGVDRTFLSDLERGRKSVSLPYLEVFALGYGMSLSELLADL